MDEFDLGPYFTILLTCLNEEKRIGAAIESLLDEHFLKTGELIVLDGGSRDRTCEIVQGFIAKGWPIRLLDNPGRIQAEGLNIGLREAQAKIIIRTDAHCVYPCRYIERCVSLLVRPDVVDAGGVMCPVGEGPVQSAIALAMFHPVGVGDAKYHLGNYQGYYDGVYLGAFKREIFDRIGGYDPSVHPNEDGDLSIRILAHGGKIWLDGSLQVTYFPRDSFGKLFAQYFNYGRGRCRTTLKHRRFTSWRQVLPPILVLSLAGALGLALVHPLFLLWIAFYLGCVFGVATIGRFDPKPKLMTRLLIFPAFVIMHTAWGLGFWAGLFSRKPRLRNALGPLDIFRSHR